MNSTYRLLFIGWLTACNLITFVLFWLDKQYARKSQWRIPEKDLLLCALLGGGIGALAGMYRFHHKTRHPKFTIGIPAIILIQLIALYIKISHNLT